MRPITNKPDKVVVYSKMSPTIEFSDASIKGPDDDVTNGKRDEIMETEWKTNGKKQMEFSASVRSMATKVDKVMTFDERLLSLKSHNPFITWPRAVT